MVDEGHDIDRKIRQEREREATEGRAKQERSSEWETNQ